MQERTLARGLLTAVFAAATGMLAASAAQAATPSVTAPVGVISGMTQGNADIFLGVPFAAPPMGQGRWQPSTPLASYPAPVRATTARMGCAAPISADVGETVNEDCLYLNIYRPAGVDAHASLPVTVFIHGGGNQTGTPASYDGTEFATRTHSIVVIPTYRLGVFGFLALGGERGQPQGDLALSDIISALKWTHDNIAAFGGNATGMSVVGESAGAANICDVLTAPAAHGLVTQAIMQSGFCPGRPTRAVMEAIGTATAQAAGCTGPDPLSCMKRLPVPALLAAWNTVWQQPTVRLKDGTSVSRPLFPVTPSGSTLQPKPVDAAIRAGAVGSVPVLIGFNRDELRTFLAGYYPLSTDRYHALLKQDYSGFAADLQKEYPLTPGQDPVYTLSALRTDQMLICPALRAAAVLNGPTHVAVYEFADRTAPPFRSLAMKLPDAPGFDRGASHTAELLYLFGYKSVAGPLSPVQQALSAQMMDMWATFGRSGTTAPWPAWTPQAPDVTVLAPPADGGIRVEHDVATRHHCGFWGRHPAIPNSLFP
ncbi:carboxylesterase/lipase family protein [Komagataeibacter oboediens]|uniref:Carboxylic ester hydrolase n=1 Tax=Komagataeibacter oboediens TaxID=65958 RepID=A0ABS5SRE0_9PROT|nr:carboxylesterase family protein [Komagataeibacter oboediens]MBL7232688.1 carboxylesterase family protein [Komagataeibacter oboediens]MBT0676040.1 carboxylesterase family protein [Komagataeibacter oboediens]MBT0679603.1 carboxylesterase family protein [Komagataeibacter oboediens]